MAERAIFIAQATAENAGAHFLKRLRDASASCSVQPHIRRGEMRGYQVKIKSKEMGDCYMTEEMLNEH